MFKNTLANLALIFGLIISAITFSQWVSAPTVNLHATVEPGLYKLHPSVQKFINTPLYDSSNIESALTENGTMKSEGFSAGQIQFVAEMLRHQLFKLQQGFNNDARNFLIYKIENSGDKSALNVALVNSLDGVALIEGNDKSITIKDKDALELGEIPPRSSKIIYFWTSSYYYSRWDSAFVKHSDGIVDVDATIQLGGFYKHLHDYGLLYLLMGGAIALSTLYSILNYLSAKNKSKSEPPETNNPSKPKRRRRRRSKTKALPAP